jgi:hypothetical protein
MSESGLLGALIPTHMRHCCLKFFIYRYNLECKGVLLR